MNNSTFETMMHHLSSMSEEKMITECMSLKPNTIKEIPLRYRIIAMGFIRRLTLDELNEKLESTGCARLYSRNYKEAGLIYAFLHGLNYEEWLQLSLHSEEVLGTVLDRKMYSGRYLYLKDLKNYVHNYSIVSESKLQTKAETKKLSEQLRKTNSEDDFYHFLEVNLDTFSEVREKARYYFCKYLLAFLEQKIQDHYNHNDPGITEYLRFDIRKLPTLEADDFYRFVVSLSGLYYSFNHYYFGYPNSDWMDILLDYYGDISSLPEHHKKEFASSLRRYYKKWKHLSDDEIIAAKIIEMEEEETRLDHLYSSGRMDSQIRSRSGEKVLRYLINGDIDIDRTSLLCYLLFFGQDFKKSNPLYLSQERVNHILQECGYGILKKEDDFDSFILNFINSSDPLTYLMETATEYALNFQNFYLYHMHYNGCSHSKLFDKYMR